MQMGSKKRTMGNSETNRVFSHKKELVLREHNFGNLDGVFFYSMPTMGTSDFATMISRIVATPAAGEVDG